MALVMVTGGARSGKSRIAQQLALARAREVGTANGSAQPTPVVVVVFGRYDRQTDPEFAERIDTHRAGRPPAFRTLEATHSLSWVHDVPPDALVLVDCLGTMVGRTMEELWRGGATGEAGAARESAEAGAEVRDAGDEIPLEFERAVQERVDSAIEWLSRREGDTVVVTNEVGSGVVPPYATGRVFRDVLGRANRELAARADAAYLVVAGKAMNLSMLADYVPWPSD